MKTGRYLKIKKAFAQYRANKRILSEISIPTISGVDYSAPSIVGDTTNNAQENMIIGYLAKKEDLEKMILLVDEVYEWYAYEGYGRDRYVKLRLIEGNSPIWVCQKIGIDERTGRRWQRDIFEKAEMIAEKLGAFL